MSQEIRWKKRFHNYVRTFEKLAEAVEKIKQEYPIQPDGHIAKDNFLDNIIKEGLIQRFEYTHELAWNVMKDFLTNAGNNNIFGSKDATREAFAVGIILNGEIWMDMIQSRNKTSHTYNSETADDIFLKIIHEYYEEFLFFKNKMQEFIKITE
ncbi:MAG: nucleotidyltransferase substrate binding protein [Raineya sp.]|nr:nucleotidyltransferase substrate binding protein [Raineya sp.]